jgi:exodeoxyribonuclease V alpha subunit
MGNGIAFSLCFYHFTFHENSRKLANRYGKSKVKTLYYRLVHDIFGIGFLTADKIAQKLGFDEKSPLRAEAAIIFKLHELADEGHVYYPQEELISQVKEMLSVDESVLEIAMQSLLAENKIVIENWRDDGAEICGVFLSGYHFAEIIITFKTLLR